MDISIVVVNYNTAELTRSCLSSIQQYTFGLAYEIILVDNASTEIDSKLLIEQLSAVSIVTSETNSGFAAGNNLGIKEATGKYIILLNSDTRLQDNAFHELFLYMESNPEVGAISPKLIFPSGESQSAAQRFPSLKYSLFEALRLQKLFNHKRAGRILLGAFFDHNETVKADWIWGTCFMFRREVIEKLPGKKLDDTYFMYCEDMQWCMDIKKLGYEVHFNANAEIVHLMGGSSADKNRMMLANREHFLKRNYPTWKIWLINRLNNLLVL